MVPPTAPSCTCLLLSCLFWFTCARGSPSAFSEQPYISTLSSDLQPIFEDHAIDFSAALQIEASIRQRSVVPTSVPALPVPTNVNQIPEYNAVAEIAATPLPLLQAGQQLSNIGQALGNISAIRLPAIQPLLPRRDKPRLMIVGDSISNGQQGDYTWRYRLWQWFQSQRVAVEFVGPYKGTYQSATALATGPQPPPRPPSLYGEPVPIAPPPKLEGGYARDASPAFTSTNARAHFSVWGRALAVDKGLIADVLHQYPADIILLELGFNDMGWYYSDCFGTLNSLQTFIHNARAVNPYIKLTVANVPQRSFIRDDLVSNISTYNALLPKYLRQWSTAKSPIHLVDFEQEYDCGTESCPAAYDGLHPNAFGEFQIANAFAKSLSENFGLGSSLPIVPTRTDVSLVRQIGSPGGFRLFASPQGVTALWNAVYGAYSYDVNVSIDQGGPGFSPASTSLNRWDSAWPLPGWKYSVRVRAACGDQYGPWTPVQSALAAPQLPGLPQNVDVIPTNDGFTISWAPPTGPHSQDVFEYNVLYFDSSTSDRLFIGGAAFKHSPANISGLALGHSYFVAPLAWNGHGQGLPNIARHVIPGAGVPAAPKSLQVLANDNDSVHLTWAVCSNATGYEVFARDSSGNDAFTSIANVSLPCCDVSLPSLGSGSYEFRVAAFNGNLQSIRSPAAVLAQTSGGGTTKVTCPAVS